MLNANPVPAEHQPAGGPRTSAHDQTRREPRDRKRVDGRGMALRNMGSPGWWTLRIEGEPASPIQDLTQAAGPCTHRSRNRGKGCPKGMQ